MTLSTIRDGLAWTEDTYLALGETAGRIELLDGCLLVRPTPTPYHQAIASRLTRTLDAAAEPCLEAYRCVNIRLKPCRICIPDVVVLRPTDPDAMVSDVDNVRLIGEVTSPWTAAADRILKMRLYAEARIPWYLMVEQDEGSAALHLFRLDGEHYVEHAVGVPGIPLTMTEPVAVTIDPADLLPRRRR